MYLPFLSLEGLSCFGKLDSTTSSSNLLRLIDLFELLLSIELDKSGVGWYLEDTCVPDGARDTFGVWGAAMGIFCKTGFWEVDGVTCDELLAIFVVTGKPTVGTGGGTVAAATVVDVNVTPAGDGTLGSNIEDVVAIIGATVTGVVGIW